MESENASVRRTATHARAMCDNFARELGLRGHGGLALLMLLALSLYIFGAALRASLEGSGFDECSSVSLAMFTALRIPVFDDVGLSFVLRTATKGRVEAFVICVVLIIVVGFGVLSGLIAVFGNALVVPEEEDDEDEEATATGEGESLLSM